MEFLSQFVELEERNGEWWGLSCFKEEKTPSFSVRRNPPVFFDYSSGIGGNVFTFVKYYYKCSGGQAAKILKNYAGFDGQLAVPRDKLSATIVCKRFKQPKTPAKKAASTILPDNYMERYEKRKSKLAVWEKEGVSSETLDKFQVCYDGFSNRLVYPIRNTEGEIVNIGGRTLDPCYKEKGLRKYNYFYPWGRMNTIYGLSENKEHILKSREIILFEGCKSVLLADTWGIYNTGAILTSHLNPDQMKLLARLGCKTVFALDKDVRIRNDRNIERLKQYVNVYYLWDREDLLDEKDSPVDKGKEVFKKMYEQKLWYR